MALGHEFSDMAKTDKLNFVKINYFCSVKDTIHEIERQTIGGEIHTTI